MLGVGTEQLRPPSLESSTGMAACLSHSVLRWPLDKSPSVSQEVKQGATSYSGISEIKLQSKSDQISKAGVS